MADSFMIRFLYEGKPCYANVYLYDTPRQYHVHIVNSVLHSHLPDTMVLTLQDDKLRLHEPDDIPQQLVNSIVRAIEEHFAR